MTIVKKPILQALQQLIGIAPSASPLVMDDANVSLTLPIVPEVARRSNASQNTGGLFQGVLENVHSGADDERSQIDPYLAGPDAFGAWPPLIPQGFDVWLLGICGEQTSGVAGLTGATCKINIPNSSLGWGRDDAGAPVVATPRYTVALFDSVTSIVGNNNPVMITEQGNPWVTLNMRLNRGHDIVFDSTSGAAAEYRMLVFLGLFPSGMGQDGLT
ncbi:MAG: hypothetical protein V3S25_00655 [Nitrospirales bacterium]